eukprot:752482-Hanusia_phi.AAC.5
MYRHHAEGRGEQTAGKGRPLLEHILLLVQDTEMSSWAVVSEVLRPSQRDQRQFHHPTLPLQLFIPHPAVAIHCPEVPADAEHGHGPEDIAGPQPEVGVGDASSQEVRRHALERLGQVLSPVGELKELRCIQRVTSHRLTVRSLEVSAIQQVSLTQFAIWQESEQAGAHTLKMAHQEVSKHQGR